MSRVESGAAGEYRRILLVEASACDRQVLADRLRAALGAEVVEAGEAYAALRLTQCRPEWDAMVVPLDETGLNGFELFLQIEAAVGRPVAVVFTTAGDGPGCVRLGAARTVRVLRKPFTAAESLRALAASGTAADPTVGVARDRA